MKATIVIIGDEILLGRVTDTNSGFIARSVDPLGIKIGRIVTVGDERQAIYGAVTDALETSDIVFTTGGLGPTKDDITKNILTEIFGGEIVRDDSITRNIEEIFKGRNLKLNNLTLDQALVPSTAHIIQNRFGTAPIMAFRKGEKILVAMPGVPYETEGMMAEVLAYIKQLYLSDLSLRHFTRIVTGLSESALAINLAAFEDSLPAGVKLAYLPTSPIIRLRLDCQLDDSSCKAVVENFDKVLNDIEGLHVLAAEDLPLAAIVIKELEARQLKLSTAESCTGGNIAHQITSVAGSSAVFNGCVVSYANTAKTDVLDVSAETLEKYGAVSRQTVVQMAEGVSHIMSTGCAIATSGIAGPTGGTDDKPVGTVWMAIKTPAGIHTFLHRFPGNRERVIERATSTALIHLLECL